MVITGPQLRAARGFLDWTRTQCAIAASVSPETIKNIEMGKFPPSQKTSESLINVLSDNGLELTGSEGVKKKSVCAKCGAAV